MSRFGTIATPAASVGEVLALLDAEHEPAFVYRGQIRDWCGPLLPSAFRRHVQTGEIFEAHAGLPRASMRGTGGASFVELEPINQLFEFADSASQTHLSLPELTVIERLIDNVELSLSIAVDGEAALAGEVPTILQGRFAANRSMWKVVIDAMHRNRIRQLVCLNGFGFVLGMAVAQHYGFASEALDVTHDPRVAAFFATHDGPRYARASDTGLGVIFRFRVGDDELDQRGWNRRDFYTAPAFVSMGPILRSFSVPRMTYSESVSSLLDHVLVALEGGREARDQHAPLLGDGALEGIRVFAQRAALLLPDMLLEEREVLGTKQRTMMAVEDLKTHPGTEVFYFRHHAAAWRWPDLTRERLWPQNDVFVGMFRAILGRASPKVLHPTGIALPLRPDLLDAGYTS